MAFHDDPLVLFYLALAVVVIGYLVMMAVRSRSPEEEAPRTEGQEAERRHGEDLLLQFVQDEEGKRYGETVAVEGDKLVIKEGQTFYMAPLSSFRKGDEAVLLTGTVDWEAAKAAGEAWRERSTKVITYSEEEIPPEDLRED